MSKMALTPAAMAAMKKARRNLMAPTMRAMTQTAEPI